MYTYFLVLNDFGIRPTTVWFLATEKGFLPDKNDVYDSNDRANGYGNSNFKMFKEKTQDEIVALDLQFRTLAWDRVNNASIDVRLFYNYPEQYIPAGQNDWLNQRERTPESWTECRWPYKG